MWELIQAYDLPVEYLDPPMITKTLLHVAIMNQAPPAEVKKIAAHFENMDVRNNMGRTVY